MANDIFKPTATSPRHPLETKKVHGKIHNPPRMMEMGGASSLRAAGGPHKSNLPAIRKPGDTGRTF